MEIIAYCAGCGASISVDTPVRRQDECPKCKADLRACRQCASFEIAARGSCREPGIEPVRDKEKANYCEYFRFQGGKGTRSEQSKADLRAAAEALFKKKE